MAQNETSRACPQCGNPLPGDAPLGLCPQCLLKNGLVSEANTTPTYQRNSGGGSRDSYRAAGRFIAPTVAELAPLFPQMEVLELLGQGGMGAVYKAKQRGLDRLVAVKILPPDLGGMPGFADRFTREARALAKLNHPNIVSVFDFGSTPGETGLYYLVMEYIDGVNLRQAMRTKSMTPPEALAIVPQVCEALQFAHDEGIVHRDIKPENILIDKRGKVKIADFGLAKLIAGAASPDDITLTREGGSMGTPHYMAPEQIEGAHAVDHRADIYSLGVVFYEMLTGELPLGRFAAPSKKVKIDVRLDEIVLRTLEKEPELRYQHASEVKTQVDGLRGVSPAAVQRMFGKEYKSQATFFGLPLLHIAFGIDPKTGRKRVAKGVIAIGDIAVGGVAFGGIAMGGLTFAGVGVGLISISGMALGLLLAIGGFAVGGVAWGGFAAGAVASGGFAAGYYAHGGAAFGVHAAGANVQDPEALRFFGPWIQHWNKLFILLATLCPVFCVAVTTLAWIVLRNSDQPGAAAKPRKPDDLRQRPAGASTSEDGSGLACAVLAAACFAMALLAPLILFAAIPGQSAAVPAAVFIAGLLLAFLFGLAGRRHRLGRYTAVMALLLGLTVPGTLYLSAYKAPSPRGVSSAGAVTYLDGHTSIAKGVAVSRDGKTLASVGMDGRLIVRDLPSGDIRFVASVTDVRADRPGSPLFCVTIGPTGEILAGGNAESVSILKSAVTPTATQAIFAPSRGTVRGVMTFDQGRKFAYVDGDTDVVFFDPKEGKALSRSPIYPGKAFGNVRAVAGSPDGRFIAVTSSNMTGDGPGGARSIEPSMLTVYHNTGEPRLSFQIDQPSDFSNAQIVFPDARTLVMCLPSGRMQTWKLGDDDEWSLGASPRISPARFTAIAASSDGKIIWLAHEDEITGIDAQTGESIAFAQVDAGKRAKEFASSPIEALAPTGEPLTVAAALWNGKIAIARCERLQENLVRPQVVGVTTPANVLVASAPPIEFRLVMPVLNFGQSGASQLVAELRDHGPTALHQRSNNIRWHKMAIQPVTTDGATITGTWKEQHFLLLTNNPKMVMTGGRHASAPKAALGEKDTNWRVEEVAAHKDPNDDSRFRVHVALDDQGATLLNSLTTNMRGQLLVILVGGQCMGLLTLPEGAAAAQLDFEGLTAGESGALVAALRDGTLPEPVAPAPRPPGLLDFRISASADEHTVSDLDALKADLRNNGPLAGRPRGAKLQWFEANADVAAGLVTATHDGKTYALLSASAPNVMLWSRPIAGEIPRKGDGHWAITAAHTTRDPDATRELFMLTFRLDESGRQMLAELTKKNVGRHLAILSGGKVIAAPKINSAINGGESAITGLSLDEANRITDAAK